MRPSIATVCMSGTLEEKVEAAAEAGFAGVEIMDADVVSSKRSPVGIRRFVESLGMRVEIFQPFRDFEGVGAEQFERNIRRAKAKLDVAAELGAPLMLLCSNVASATLDDDGLVASQLNRLGDLAQQRGLLVAYEALAWGRFVSTFDHAWRLADRADHPAIGTCLDSFHIFAAGSDLELALDLPADRLFFCQVADARALSMDALSWSRHHRLFPGQGSFDLTRFVSVLQRVGYIGPLSIEVFNDVFRQSDARRTAVDALRSLRYLEETVTTDRTHLVGAPAHPAVDFIELRGAESATTSALSALGFVGHGRHASKDVTLWSQGDVAIVVNQHPLALSPSDRTALTGVGFQVDDARRRADRADELLARRVTRTQRAGEDVLYGMLAPDSSEMYLSDEAVRSNGWREEFPSVEPNAGVGVHGIDHISLSQSWEHFDEAVLFYRSMLGLEPAELVDIADQRGLVSSLAMESADRATRVVLTVNPIGHSEGSNTMPPHHVAFAVTDILATADALAARGASRLEIPSNYFDDLQARFDLGDETLEALRSRHILYDRDADGEFWQLYTPHVGDIFFEFVQRRGGYDGYGAPNASVRRAAQQSVSRNA